MPRNARRPQARRPLGPYARAAASNGHALTAIAAAVGACAAFGLCAFAKAGPFAAAVGNGPALAVWALCALAGLACLAACGGFAFAAVAVCRR